jgi:hypothetical protein
VVNIFASNANVATIDCDTGLITAIAPGTVTITAISTANANVRDTFTLAIRNYVYISFDGNGYTSGNTPANTLALSGTNYTLPQRDRLSRAGYVFADWHCVTSSINYTVGTLVVKLLHSHRRLYQSGSLNPH